MREFLALLLTAATLLVLPSLACAQEVGDQWTEPITGMEFVWVPGGCYEMGCGEWAGDDCREDEYPAHEVCVDGFWMGKYEVTEGQWITVMGDVLPNESGFSSEITMGSAFGFDHHGESYPVINISEEDVKVFISNLSALSEKGMRFRLPTEAEWEYACRSGGREELYAGGNEVDSLAWYGFEGNEGQHQPVGGKAPNGLGLYDMSGNVWECVLDSYSDTAYASLQQDNPSYLNDNQRQVVRGGSWNGPAWGTRCGIRGWVCSGCRKYSIGFRIILKNFTE